MPKNKKEKPGRPGNDSLSSSDIPKQKATKTKINYRDKPASTHRHKIHPRQPIPPLPKGKKILDDCPSPPTEID